MAIFSDTEYEKLLWNVHLYDLDRDNLFDKFPDLDRASEFKTEVELNINSVIAYIVYTYDMNSPFVKKYDQIERRKKYAAAEAGFENEGYVFTPEVNDMTIGANMVVNGMIFKYCRLQMNDEWTSLCIYREVLYSELEKMKSPSDKDKIKDIIDTTKKLREEIASLTIKFLIGDTTKALVYDFQRAVESDDLIPRPEEIALRIQQKKEVLPNWVMPYRENIHE